MIILIIVSLLVISTSNTSSSSCRNSKLVIRMSNNNNNKPYRTVICDDTINYLMTNDDPIPGSVFTSLPDISELPNIFNKDSIKDTSNNKDSSSNNNDARQLEIIRRYKEWFTDIVSMIFDKMHTGEYAIFLQSDVRCLDKSFKGTNVLEWIDKSHLVSIAMDRNKDIKIMWHKIVTTSENAQTKLSAGRPSYSHLICYCKGNDTKYSTNSFATPDIFYRGDMLWPKGIGLSTALLGCSFLKDKTNVVVDPFCGVGTVLAMANAVGINSIGIEISDRRCRKARRLSLDRQLHEMKPSLRRAMGLLNYDDSKYTGDSNDDNDVNDDDIEKNINDNTDKDNNDNI